jgi:glycosyltransferase involved in cell wall biosynthesis
MSNRIPKIAWLSPFPPQRSGIANYSHWLIKALKPHLDIDLYYDKTSPSSEIASEFDVFPISLFPERRTNYDEVVYHLGNNRDFHKNIYQLAWDFPATIVLHDYYLNAFMRHAFYRQTNSHLYELALSDGGNQATPKGIHGLLPKVGRNISGIPMSHAVVARSKKVVVHHRWVKNQFPDMRHIEVIPLYAKINQPPTQEHIDSFKRRFLIKDNEFLITCLGFVNTNKLPALQIEVTKRLLDQEYPVRLFFAGETAPDVKHLQSEVESGKNREHITFAGYLDEADYFSALFASDILINLRNPSMGEASLTLAHGLAAGKPTIISDLNQYKEFPDNVCWKLTHDENEAELLYHYLTTLLSNKNLRAALSANSLDYVETVLALDRIVPHWLRVLSK